MRDLDPGKARLNKATHGIDFIEAQAPWNDPQRVEIAARRVAEPRYLVIGQIENTIRTAVTSRDATVADAKGAARQTIRKHRKSLERLAGRD